MPCVNLLAPVGKRSYLLPGPGSLSGRASSGIKGRRDTFEGTVPTERPSISPERGVGHLNWAYTKQRVLTTAPYLLGVHTSNAAL